MKLGEIKNKEIFCSSLYPFYLFKIEQYRNSPLCKGVLSDWLLINPPASSANLEENDDVSFVPMTSVKEKTNSVNYEIRPYAEVKKGYTTFKRGDMLWAKITPCMQNGKSCIVDDLPTEIGFGSTEFHVLRHNGDKVYMPYIWSILSSDDVLKAAQATFNGSAGQQRVSDSFLRNFPALLPDYDIQVQMVTRLMSSLSSFKEKLDYADKLLSSMNEFVNNSLALPNLIIEKRMTYAIRLSELRKSRYDTEYNHPHFTKKVEEIKKLPHATLDEIINFSNESWNQSDYFDDEFPYIEISGVGLKTNEYEVTLTAINQAASRARMIVRNQDIIVSTTRPHRGSIATINCRPNQILIASTGFAVLREMKRTDITKEYLQWILLNDYVLEQFLQRSSGGNYPAINLEELKKVVIPIPDETTQKIIVSEAIRRRTLARKLKEEAEKEWYSAKSQFEKELLGGIRN